MPSSVLKLLPPWNAKTSKQQQRLLWSEPPWVSHMQLFFALINLFGGHAGDCFIKLVVALFWSKQRLRRLRHLGSRSTPVVRCFARLIAAHSHANSQSSTKRLNPFQSVWSELIFRLSTLEIAWRGKKSIDNWQKLWVQQPLSIASSQLTTRRGRDAAKSCSTQTDWNHPTENGMKISFIMKAVGFTERGTVTSVF